MPLPSIALTLSAITDVKPRRRSSFPNRRECRGHFACAQALALATRDRFATSAATSNMSRRRLRRSSRKAASGFVAVVVRSDCPLALRTWNRSKKRLH